MERSTINALVNSSSSCIGHDSLDNAMDALLQERKSQKMLELAQLVYYGTLELTLFSGFDLKGGESILALQHRLAQQLIPHDVPHPKDFTPLLDILQENISGRHVAHYRYLWCECLATTLFTQLKDAYTMDADSMPKLGRQYRRLLLDRGAALDIEAMRNELNLQECSPDALFQLYNL